MLGGFLHQYSFIKSYKTKKRPEGRLEFTGFVVEEPVGGDHFESDGSERQTGGLTGGLGDVELHVPAQACLSAISVPKS